MLLKYLDSRESGSPVIISSEREFSAEAIMDFCNRFRDAYKLQGRAVALRYSLDHFVWPLIFALDGFASSILMLPQGLSEEVETRFIADCSCTCILEPASFESGKFPVYRLAGESAAHDNDEIFTGDSKWILATSGTTGTPKLVIHSTASLCRTVKAGSRKFSGMRWGLTYNLIRFAGLQVFLQAVASDATLIIPENTGDMPQMLALFSEHACQALSATPTWWRKCLMHSSEYDISLSQVTLGGEIADQIVLDSLSARFPEARIVHIYASTEAGVGFSVRDKKAGFPRSYIDEGVPGLQMRVSGEDMLLVKPDIPPEGYVGLRLFEDDGFIDTGDKVQITEDRILFLGRVNGSINVGGSKVMPEEVEAVILSIEGIEMCSVGARKSPITGALVEAQVVYKGELDAKELSKGVKSVCREKLEAYKVPAFVKVVDDLQITSAGKMRRSS